MPLKRSYSPWLLTLIAVSLVPVAIGLATASRHGEVEASLAPAAAEPQSSSPQLHAHAAGTLPVALQDAAAAATGSQTAALLGGLDSSDTSRATIQKLSPGHATALGTLKTPLHDAAAATLGSSVYLFGGGQTSSYSEIVRVDPRTGTTAQAGQLPEPRSDLGAATVGGTAYLVGGFTGQTPLDTILAWSPASGARVAGHLPHPLRYAAVAADGNRIVIAGGMTPNGPSSQVLSFDPATGSVTAMATLPHAVSHAAAAALGGYVYVIGGRDASDSPVRRIVAIDPRSGTTVPGGSLPQPLSDAAAVTLTGQIMAVGGRTTGGVTARMWRLTRGPQATARVQPARTAAGPLLRPGSNPAVLPGNLLIADKGNNRLLEVTPQGRIVWRFPRAGDLPGNETFLVPDDAFFSYDGRKIVATEEDVNLISVVDVGRRRISYRYGHPGTPGAAPGYVQHPDDAMLLRSGKIVSADIENCRLIQLRPPLQRPVKQLGATGGCFHQPPVAFSSPNGAFPKSDGGTVVTEIGGVWADLLDRSGKLTSAVNVPGFSYPSDTNEVRPGVYLTVDYASPGSIMEFDAHGHVLWRYSPRGADTLDHPSLALPLPNGDVLANDDYNDRVIVVDPHTNHIVWQYGHTAVSGTAPGYLYIPDGVDLAPPYALADRFPAWPGLPGG